jgi:biotin synthase
VTGASAVHHSPERLAEEIADLSTPQLAEVVEHYATAPTGSAHAHDIAELFAEADAVRQRHYGRRVLFRGLIEFTSYCTNGCLYCGIRAGNPSAVRYRLSDAEILDACAQGHELGFRTFVLQGGEDPAFTDDRACGLVAAIKRAHPECAITLSLGERSRASYARLRDAGADRYLLRHETASAEHYAMLHPPTMRLETRLRCLWDLRDLGYQVGAGFMVGTPYQTSAYLAEDLAFLRELQPEMVGVGPFVPHSDTPFRDSPVATMHLTLVMLALTRLMLPTALIPATTALGSIDPLGREKALSAGANVVMPNLSPLEHRADYALYDNKICTGEEAAECVSCLAEKIEAAGYDPDFSRGDHPSFELAGIGAMA